jgi:ComF family protein
MGIINTTKEQLLDFLFLKFCLLCDMKGSYMCAKCRSGKIKIFDRQICHVCGNFSENNLVHQNCQPQTNLSAVYSSVHYNKNAARLLTELKYSLHSAVASELAEILLWKLDSLRLSYDLIIPIPLSRKRLWWRGFNQAELLAQYLGAKKENSKLLRRTRHTRTQVGLDRSERLNNLKDAFLASEQVDGKTILLVDDVYTTGSTMEACAEALLQAGAADIIGLTWARD